MGTAPCHLTVASQFDMQAFCPLSKQNTTPFAGSCAFNPCAQGFCFYGQPTDKTNAWQPCFVTSLTPLYSRACSPTTTFQLCGLCQLDTFPNNTPIFKETERVSDHKKPGMCDDAFISRCSVQITTNRPVPRMQDNSEAGVADCQTSGQQQVPDTFNEGQYETGGATPLCRQESQNSASHIEKLALKLREENGDTGVAAAIPVAKPRTQCVQRVAKRSGGRDALLREREPKQRE